MLNFVLCDDNKAILTKLSKMLEAIFIQHSYDATVVYECTTAEELLSFLNTNVADVILLDINLKSKLSGLDLAEKLRKLNKKFYLIFTTGHLEYSLLAYQFKTFDYIAKPITLERLESTIERLFDDALGNTKFLKIGGTQLVVKEDDVEYIKKEGMKIVYKTQDRKYEAYCSFTKIEDALPKSFVRCHKSFIVNINNIQDIQVSKNTIHFQDNESCMIGPKYKNNLMEVLNNYGILTNSVECTDNPECANV